MNNCAATGKTVVFFDGGCPLCRKEINHYQRLDTLNRIRWLDITDNSVNLEQFQLTVDQAMRQLHAIDKTGTRVIGVAAFIAIWTELPGYRYLPGIIRRLGLRRPLQWLYEKFADRRYRKRGCGCQ